MKPQLAQQAKTVGDAAPGPFASFVRFVVCGGGIGVLSSGAVALLAGAMPWVVANAVITVASTVLCTELHALFTFGTGKRAGWRQHWQSAGSATAAYAVTSLAMLILHLVQSSPGMLTEQVVYLSASGLAGTGRFLVLRLFVFAGGRDGGQDQDRKQDRDRAFVRKAAAARRRVVSVPTRLPNRVLTPAALAVGS
ncbi:putative flippase GtrA [Streptomyces phaeochromogenes]|uniref:GtrA family protein n=1 Tax=Streptomyces TaxID=1883 RepID=UPI0021B134C7|nr:MULTISPECIES: GtrA family protein [Streptomyces]MDQ0950540.1 putative flippase GtrA [Streptomyces phaeochromogenes]